MEQVEFARDGPRERDTYGQRRIGCVRSIDSDRSRTQHVVRVGHGNRDVAEANDLFGGAADDRSGDSRATVRSHDDGIRLMFFTDPPRALASRTPSSQAARVAACSSAGESGALIGMSLTADAGSTTRQKNRVVSSPARLNAQRTPASDAGERRPRL
jgi:hypothetical protein